MKSAEEILKDNGVYIGFRSTYDWDSIVKAINEARKEVIEECAKDAAKFIEECEGSSFGIDEELLLKINELK